MGKRIEFYLVVGVWAGLVVALWQQNALGWDFTAFWSVGWLARVQGFAAAYDVQTLAAFQRAHFGEAFSVVPAPYLPPFLLPFMVLSHWPFLWARWVWILLTWSVVSGYIVWRLGQGVHQHAVLWALLAYPLFEGVWAYGQLSPWLVIVVGEALKAAQAGREFGSGLRWSLIWLKPALAPAVVVHLLASRAWRALGGFALGSVALVLFSWALAGTKGLLALVRLWGDFSEGLMGRVSAAGVDHMVNWRMVGTHLAQWGMPPWFSWGVVGMLALATLLWWGWWLYRFPVAQRGRSPLAWLGTLLAGQFLAWHMHIHSAVWLLPALLLWAGEQGEDTRIVRAIQVLAWWPIGGVVIGAGLVIAGYPVGDLSRPVAMMTWSLGLLVWLTWAMCQGKESLLPGEDG